MDLRQIKSRKKIICAFQDLLAQKSFNKITVLDIIQKAKVGRTTFYAHFETKDALLLAMCSEIFDHIFMGPLTKEKTHDFSNESKDAQNLIVHMLYHLRDNTQNIINLFAYESRELFIPYFRSYIDRYLTPHLLAHYQEKKIPNDFLRDHISYSFVSLVDWWIKNDLKQSPDDLACYFLWVMPQGLVSR